MTRYTNLTNFQLFLLALLTGLIAAALVLAATKYEELKLLPEVTVSPTGQCIKVTNFENGHAFACPDVDVLLRRYRKVTSTAS
jgi:hypothetical protein